MIYLIEKGFQVDIHNVVITFIDIPLRCPYRLMGLASESETIASGLELHLEKWVDDLGYRLPQHTVRHGGNAQKAVKITTLFCLLRAS